MAAVAALDAAATALTSLQLQLVRGSVPFLPAAAVGCLESGLEERQRSSKQQQLQYPKQQQQQQQGWFEVENGVGGFCGPAGVVLAEERGVHGVLGDQLQQGQGGRGSSSSSSRLYGWGKGSAEAISSSSNSSSSSSSWGRSDQGHASGAGTSVTVSGRAADRRGLMSAGLGENICRQPWQQAPPPAAAAAATDLKVFEFSGGYLRQLPASVQALMSLHTLVLNQNSFRADDLGCIGLMTQLTRLELTKNLLLELPLSWSSLRELRVLELGGNALGEWPGVLMGVAGGNLQRLVLKGNQLLLLPEGVSSLGRLSHLDLSSNKLQVSESCNIPLAEISVFLDTSKGQAVALSYSRVVLFLHLCA